jgi:hypothetical protein
VDRGFVTYPCRSSHTLPARVTRPSRPGSDQVDSVTGQLAARSAIADWKWSIASVDCCLTDWAGWQLTDCRLRMGRRRADRWIGGQRSRISIGHCYQGKNNGRTSPGLSRRQHGCFVCPGRRLGGWSAFAKLRRDLAGARVSFCASGGGRRMGRPASRGAHTRDNCTWASTKWGYPATGPATNVAAYLRSRSLARGDSRPRQSTILSRNRQSPISIANRESTIENRAASCIIYA